MLNDIFGKLKASSPPRHEPTIFLDNAKSPKSGTPEKQKRMSGGGRAEDDDLGLLDVVDDDDNDIIGGKESDQMLFDDSNPWGDDINPDLIDEDIARHVQEQMPSFIVSSNADNSEDKSLGADNSNSHSQGGGNAMGGSFAQREV